MDWGQCKMAMSIDDKLGCNRFHADMSYAHIKVNKEWTDKTEIERVILACPAQLYRLEGDEVKFNHEGCLECGTCRVLSKGKVIESWNHPQGGMGVSFRHG